MAGKTKINGTAYTVKGGKTKVGGTAYSVKSGKTLIGGTSKSISFEQPMPTGCIAEYLFNNNLNDTSGSGYNLTNNGVTFSTSELSGLTYCGVFNDSTSYAKSSSTLSNDNFVSVSLWVYSQSSDKNSPIIGIGPKTKVGYNKGKYIDYTRSGSLDRIGCNVGYSGTEFSAYKSNLQIYGGWHHIVGIITNITTPSNCKLYLDGEEIPLTTTSPTGSVQLSSGSIAVGKLASDKDYFRGKLAAIRIYNRVLSADEVAVLYNNGQGR